MFNSFAGCSFYCLGRGGVFSFGAQNQDISLRFNQTKNVAGLQNKSTTFRQRCLWTDKHRCQKKKKKTTKPNSSRLKKTHSSCECTVLRLARCCHLLAAGTASQSSAVPKHQRSSSLLSHTFICESCAVQSSERSGALIGGIRGHRKDSNGWLRFRRGVYFWDMSQRNTIFKVSRISFPREPG